jgi:Peptidase M10 serralysin C terminal/RTX calcium-binding nonapeptide repeat (4 copies)
MTAIPQEIGSEFLVNTTTENDQVLSAITGLPNGGFVVTWIDGSGLSGGSSVPSIKAQIFDATGAEVGSEFLVNTTTTDSLDTLSVTGLNDGSFVVTWMRFSLGVGFSIEAQLFDATGAKVGGEFQVSRFWDGNIRYQPTVTGLSHGGFVVTWADSATNEAQIFDSTGAKVGSEFRVDPTILGFHQGHPTVIGLSNGGFIITWHDTSSQSGDSSRFSIKAQVFDASGARVGSKLLVNATTAGDQVFPTIADLSNGGFVIAWVDDSSQGGDSSGSSIKAQVFSATGTKVGSKFLVNSTTEGYQDLPTVTGLNNGGFVITWRDSSGLGDDNSGSSIKAQVFSATGTKVGSEFLVNSTIAGTQWLPSITGLNNGGFVVTWTDDSGQGGDSSASSIKAQIFGTNDNAPVITTAGTQTVAENTKVVTALTSTDADAVASPAVFSITGGADAALFQVLTAADGSQSLQFLAAPDYETNPHSYQVQVSAFDGVNTTAKMITVNLTDVNEAPTAVALANATASILENTPTATHIKVADINVTDDALGSNILALTGADAASFEIVGSALYLKAGTVLDFESKTSYAVAVTVDDPTVGATPDATSTIFALNVTNVPGVTITGTSAANTIDATHTVAGQPLPTNEEDTINAGGGNDTINALGGNDFINGGAGADKMFGGTGNDTYVVDNGGDIVNETGGNGLDTVQSSITFSLSDAAHAIGVIENLTLTGTAAINGTGNALANVITGNSGNNVIAGLGGADILNGGGGTDTATYATSPAGVNVSLMTGLGSGGDAQGDNLINFENLTGSNFSDTLEGNAGTNVLNGGTGIDTVSYEHATAAVTVNLATTSVQNTGGAGSDTLSNFENLIGSAFNDTLTGSASANAINGGAGNDTIKGGGGADILTGGPGNDSFVFAALTDSPPAAPDIITGFTHGADIINVSAIDANTSFFAFGNQAFAYGGQNANVVARSVTWTESAGNTIVHADVNGNSTAELTIILAGINLNLTASDFIL